MALKTSVGRRLLLLGLTAGWRLANSPRGRKALHTALTRFGLRRNSSRKRRRVTTVTRRVTERVRM